MKPIFIGENKFIDSGYNILAVVTVVGNCMIGVGYFLTKALLDNVVAIDLSVHIIGSSQSFLASLFRINTKTEAMNADKKRDDLLAIKQSLDSEGRIWLIR